MKVPARKHPVTAANQSLSVSPPTRAAYRQRSAPSGLTVRYDLPWPRRPGRRSLAPRGRGSIGQAGLMTLKRQIPLHRAHRTRGTRSHCRHGDWIWESPNASTHVGTRHQKNTPCPRLFVPDTLDKEGVCTLPAAPLQRNTPISATGFPSRNVRSSNTHSHTEIYPHQRSYHAIPRLGEGMTTSHPQMYLGNGFT